MFKFAREMPFAKIIVTQIRSIFPTEFQRRRRTFDMVTPSWQIIFEQFIGNKVTNNLRIRLCLVTPWELHGKTSK